MKRLQASPATAHLDAAYNWDNEGRMTSLAYPLSGPTYGYTFDTMGRLSAMTENTGNGNGYEVSADGSALIRP